MRAPGGRFVSAECAGKVNEVPPGAVLEVGTNNVLMNGTVISHIERCPFLQDPPALSGYTEWVQAGPSTSSYNLEEATVVVPAVPVGGSTGQILYLWNGLQGATSAGEYLIQPVLEYPDQYNSNQWELRNWLMEPGFATPYGGAWVNKNDDISLIMEEVAYNDNKQTWYYGGYDLTLGGSTYLEAILPQAVTLVVAWPFVFEPKTVSSCSQLSPSNEAYAYNVSLYQSGPNWNSYNSVPSSVWTPYNIGDAGTPFCAWTNPTIAGSNITMTWQE